MVFANDVWPDAIATHTANHHACEHVLGDLSDPRIKARIVEAIGGGRVDGMCGGPPCQSFSMSGKRDPRDPRGQLFYHYIDLIRLVRPKFVIAENVKGILTALHPRTDLDSTDQARLDAHFALEGKERTRNRAKIQKLLRPVTELIQEQFADAGYDVAFRTLTASDFGVPQHRQRVIFIALRRDLETDPSDCFPAPTHGPPSSSLLPFRTTAQTIDHLRDVPDDAATHHVRMKHSEAFRAKIKATPHGQSVTPKYSESFRRLWPDRPSITMKHNNGGIAVHHAEDRVITCYEMSLLQSFPPNYVFKGSRASVAKQIGNAVPCGLAEAIGRGVAAVLRGVQPSAKRLKAHPTRVFPRTNEGFPEDPGGTGR